MSTQKLDEWSESQENSWIEYLKPETTDLTKAIKLQFIPRQVLGSHYCYTNTEHVPSPKYIATSSKCAQDIGLDPSELNTDLFLNVFAGNEILNGFNQPYATNYG